LPSSVVLSPSNLHSLPLPVESGKFVVDVSPANSSGGAGSVSVMLNASLPWSIVPNFYDGVELWLYDDEAGSWPAIYKQGKTCEEARALSKNFDPVTSDITIA
jgi:hypothetical protein